MPGGTIFIFRKEPTFGLRILRPGSDVKIGPNIVGTVERVDDERVYVKWDQNVELGSYMPRKETP